MPQHVSIHLIQILFGMENSVFVTKIGFPTSEIHYDTLYSISTSCLYHHGGVNNFYSKFYILSSHYFLRCEQMEIFDNWHVKHSYHSEISSHVIRLVLSLTSFESVIFRPSYYFFSAHPIFCFTFSFFAVLHLFLPFQQSCETVTVIVFQFFIRIFFYINATSFWFWLVEGVKKWNVVLTSCNVVFN